MSYHGANFLRRLTGEWAKNQFHYCDKISTKVASELNTGRPTCIRADHLTRTYATTPRGPWSRKQNSEHYQSVVQSSV